MNVRRNVNEIVLMMLLEFNLPPVEVIIHPGYAVYYRENSKTKECIGLYTVGGRLKVPVIEVCEVETLYTLLHEMAHHLIEARFDGADRSQHGPRFQYWLKRIENWWEGLDRATRERLDVPSHFAERWQRERTEEARDLQLRIFY